MIEQFNRIHSQGQGLDGYQTLTSDNIADDISAPVDLAGYGSKIENGSFQLIVHDLESGRDQTTTIRIDLSGSSSDTSLEDIRDQINAISGMSATITSAGGLKLDTTSSKLRFAFANDDSGFLTAAGLNTFFTAIRPRRCR